jgi:hypothetical protein
MQAEIIDDIDGTIRPMTADTMSEPNDSLADTVQRSIVIQSEREQDREVSWQDQTAVSLVDCRRISSVCQMNALVESTSDTDRALNAAKDVNIDVDERTPEIVEQETSPMTDDVADLADDVSQQPAEQFERTNSCRLSDV